MTDVLTLQELEVYDRDGLIERALATLDRKPQLRRFYDDAFITKLSGRRIHNYLLFLLCQDAGENYIEQFWDDVVADLTLLEAQGSWERFAGRFRNTTYELLQSARSELDIAARLARSGVSIVFDPVLANGRCHEFSAATASITTHWEVKQVLDEEQVRHTNAAINELQRQLRALRLPYRIRLDAERVEPKINVHAVAAEIKGIVSSFHAAGGHGKRVFSAYGIRASIAGRTNDGRVHPSTVLQGFEFDDTQAQRVRRSIKAGVKQLPEDGAGILVVDGTASDWLEVDTVEDACCGTERLAFTATDYFMARDADGVFHRERNRRLSAVVYYNRREFTGESKRYPPLVAFHNPHANIPLEPDVLRLLGDLKQYRYVPAARPGFTTRVRL